MSSASRRRMRTGARHRSVTRLHVEGLEVRLAAGTVIDLFGSSGAGLGALAQPSEIRPSKVETIDFSASQRQATAAQSRSPIISSFSAPISLKTSDGGRSSSATLSPVSSQDNAIVLDPRSGSTQAPAEPAWEPMAPPDALQRGATPAGQLPPA